MTIVVARNLNAKRICFILAQYLPPGEVPDSNDLSDDVLTTYQRAVCHDSYVKHLCQSERKQRNYERLEFLGDAILASIVSAYLFNRYPDEDEGFMTRMRTGLVNGKMLAKLCKEGTGLEKFILVSTELEARHRSAVQNRRSLPDSVLEDVLEAFIGAVFLHLGYTRTQQWVVGCLEKHVDFAELTARRDTPRSVLNRYCQRFHGFLPELQYLKDDVVRLINPLSQQVIATGSGATQKEAIYKAVTGALEYYNVSLYVI